MDFFSLCLVKAVTVTVERKVWQECIDKKDGSLDHLHGEEGKLISDWAERTHLSAPATRDDTL